MDAQLQAARALAARTAGTPSLRAVKEACRCGTDRAREILAVLGQEAQHMDVRARVLGPVPAAPQPAAEPVPGPAPVDELPATAVPAAVHPASTPRHTRAPRVWPVLILCLPAAVAVWSGWVDLGGLCGFGVVRPLPGIADGFTINTAITLPVGVEAYAAYALSIWLGHTVHAPVHGRARRFARVSAIGSLAVGATGQIVYHLLAAAGAGHAPWPVTVAVSTLPVAVLGMGAALAHLVRSEHTS